MVPWLVVSLTPIEERVLRVVNEADVLLCSRVRVLPIPRAPEPRRLREEHVEHRRLLAR